jgi:hypothetical protein
MRDASFPLLLLSLLDSGKSPLQTAADINFCDEERSRGAVPMNGMQDLSVTPKVKDGSPTQRR